MMFYCGLSYMLLLYHEKEEKDNLSSSVHFNFSFVIILDQSHNIRRLWEKSFVYEKSL